MEAAVPSPTTLTLSAYRDRVATAAAVVEAAPGRGAQATALALVGRPVSVTLRADAVRASRATADGDGGGRVMVAVPLVGEGAQGEEGTNRTKGTQGTEGTATPMALSAADWAERLGVVRDEMDASGADGTAAQGAALEQVLAERAFEDPRSLGERGWAWLRERWTEWWGDRSLPSGSGAAALRLGQIIGWVVALAVVVATAVWIARTFARLTDAARVPSSAGGPPTTPAEARARAAADAGAGDFRSAVRQLYLAALLVLEANGLLRADRSRTNREQLASLGGGDALRLHMAAVVDTFDRVWYGVTVPDGATFRAYAEDVHQLEVLAKRVPDGTAIPPGDPSTQGAHPGHDR